MVAQIRYFTAPDAYTSHLWRADKESIKLEERGGRGKHSAAGLIGCFMGAGPCCGFCYMCVTDDDAKDSIIPEPEPIVAHDKKRQWCVDDSATERVFIPDGERWRKWPTAARVIPVFPAFRVFHPMNLPCVSYSKDKCSTLASIPTTRPRRFSVVGVYTNLQDPPFSKHRQTRCSLRSKHFSL